MLRTYKRKWSISINSRERVFHRHKSDAICYDDGEEEEKWQGNQATFRFWMQITS